MRGHHLTYFLIKNIYTKVYLSTIYSHLENVLVSIGDQINQGDIIGTVGSTGRSTGPHLDFRINWFQTRLDPMSVLN